MHWLHLITMAVASAVPLPLCSVPRAPGVSRDQGGESATITTNVTIQRTEITNAEQLQLQNSQRPEDFSEPSVSDQVHFTGSSLSHQTQFSVPSVSDQVHFTASSLSHQIHFSVPSVSDQVHFTASSLSHQAELRVPSVSDQVHFTASSLSHQADFSVPSAPDQMDFNVSSVFEEQKRNSQHSINKGSKIQRDNIVQSFSGKGITSVLYDLKNYRITKEKSSPLQNHMPKNYKSQSTIAVVDAILHFNRTRSLLPLNITSKENYKLSDTSHESSTLSSEISLDPATEVKDFHGGGTLAQIKVDMSGQSLGQVPSEVGLLHLHKQPRVLISQLPLPPKYPPLLLMQETGSFKEADRVRKQEEGAEEKEPQAEEGKLQRPTGDTATEGVEEGLIPLGVSPQARVRPGRSIVPEERRGELPVCEAVSEWVMDKKTAIDDRGHRVTVLTEVQLRTQKMRQFFYETRCRPTRGEAGPAAPIRSNLGLSGHSCRGVDPRQWASECKPKHSYVRALTSDSNNRVGWRWIRIESSCVCVLLYRVTRT